MIQAIVFDCFGVLVTEGWVAFRDRYFPEGALRQQAIDLRRAADWGSLLYQEFEKDIAALAGVSVDVVRSYMDDNVVNEPLFELISKLKDRYKLGILSNAGTDVTEKLFTAEQRKLFDAVVLSFHIQAAKPDPRAYQAIADQLGVALENCVFIDDNDYFCQAARDLGMQSVCYHDFAQAKADLENLLADPKN